MDEIKKMKEQLEEMRRRREQSESEEKKRDEQLLDHIKQLDDLYAKLPKLGEEL